MIISTPTPTLPIKGGSKCAFTLAEVLITLVIIGVIAAITVPTLITKYQKEQTITRLKKAYSVISQASLRAINEYGQIKTWEFGENGNPDDAIAFIKKYIMPYVSLSKPPIKYESGEWDGTYYYLNGTQKSFDSSHVRFYFSDGTSVTAQMNTQSGPRLKLWIDINGDKKPNKCGKDIFLFSYWQTSSSGSTPGLIPNSIQKTREELMSGTMGCNRSKTGERCSAVIVKDGWRIADDYPW